MIENNSYMPIGFPGCYPSGFIKYTPDIRPIITQLKNQVIFNQCRKYIKFGCKIKSISVSDDFKNVDIVHIFPGQVREMDIQARFTK